MGRLKVAVRNLAGMPHPGGANPYRTIAGQTAAWDSLLRTGADVIVAQEASGVGRAFEPPPGWRANPFSDLGNHAGSVVAVSDQHPKADLAWRPSHPVLDAFKGFLDFALVPLNDLDIAVVSVHATRWYADQWTAAGLSGSMPEGETRPWPSDAVLDALIEELRGREGILAGDWNEALNYPRDDDPNAAAFFARAEVGGFVEAVRLAFGGPVRTNFTRNAKRSYQNDHVFLTARCAERLEQVAVFNEPHPPRGSDHAGIIVTLRDR